MTERIEQQRHDNWMISGVFIASLALIASMIGVGFGMRAIDESKTDLNAGASTAAPSSVSVHLTDFAIDPAEIIVADGGSLEVANMGATAHNLAVKDSKLATPMIDAGSTGTLALTGLKAGTYTVFCEVPGHEQAGMTAQLKIAAGGSLPLGDSPATKDMSSGDMDAAMAKSISAFPAKTAGLGAQPLAPKILADGTKQFDLTSKVVKWELAPGKTVDAWTFNGTVPGPTIHVDPGDKVRVVLHNELQESTAIHFHGLITPNAVDGVPGITQDPVKPGATFTYNWTAQATPAVGMYHSHQDAVKQVPNGMAGMFLVGELPVPAGVSVAQEQVMMLNDAGVIGLTLNGKSFPATAPIAAKLGDWVEVHYANEGLMIHPMHLHGLAQLVIAKDGYPLATPQLQDTVTVAPGERYTVLVHADNPGVWAWHCHILSHAEDETGMFGMVTAMVVK